MRTLIGLVAICVVVLKLKNESFDNFKVLKETVQYEFIFITLILLFFNWGIEAFKWKYLIQDSEKISFLTAFKLTITGITIGTVTPNRIGEIPGRALLINKKEKSKELVVKTSLGAYSQLIVTILFGSFATLFTLSVFNLKINILFFYSLFVIVSFLLLLSYSFPHYLKNFLNNMIPYLKKKKLFDALQN